MSDKDTIIKLKEILVRIEDNQKKFENEIMRDIFALRKKFDDIVTEKNKTKPKD